MMKIKFSILLMLILAFTGCAGMQTYMEHSDLDVKAYTEDTVFLEGVKGKQVFVALDNPLPELKDMRQRIEADLVERGYKIASVESVADLVMVVRVNDGQIDEKSARQVQGGTPEQSHVWGGAAGAAAGLQSGGDLKDVAIATAAGATTGALADLTVNSWVKLGTLKVRADVLLKQKVDEPVKTMVNAAIQSGTSTVINQEREVKGENYMRYHTRVMVIAKKVSLTWAECAEQVKDALAKEVAKTI